MSAGRPKGWSPVTGWSAEGRQRMARLKRAKAKADVEAFCCQQVERIERTLAVRYGFDYDGREQTEGQTVPSNRYHVMPQNDHFSRAVLLRDAEIETRR